LGRPPRNRGFGENFDANQKTAAKLFHAGKRRDKTKQKGKGAKNNSTGGGRNDGKGIIPDENEYSDHGGVKGGKRLKVLL